MGAPVIMDVLREGLWAAVLATLPILTVALVTGLAIGLFQALTSVQEMTLTFVPKLMAIVVVFWLSMGFMSQVLIGFFRDAVLAGIAGR